MAGTETYGVGYFGMDAFRVLQEQHERERIRKEQLERNNALVLQNYMLIKDAVRLYETNEKLQRLVDYMTPMAWYGASDEERDRMRELGVEVD